MDHPHASAARLRLLSTIITGKGPFLDRARDALRLTADLMGYEIGLMSQVSGTDYLVSVAHAPGTEITAGSVFDLQDTYCELTLAQDDLLEIQHAERSPHRLHPCHTLFGLESYVGVPICIDGEAWGTLSFSSSQPLAAALGEGDHDLVRLLATWIGSVLERDTRDQRLAEEAGRLHAIVDQAPIVVYGLDAEGRFTLSEGAGLASLGLEPGEVVGESIFDLYGHLDVAIVAIQRVLGGEPQSWENVNGSAVFVNKARPVRAPDGSVKGLIGVSFDVTEQARAREALAESEARLRALSAASFEGIAFTEHGRIIDGNDQLARLFGYDCVADLVDAPAQQFAAPEFTDKVTQMIRDGNPDPYEIACVRRDGSRFWAEVQGHPTPFHGRTVRMTAVRDVTSRKQAEEQRRFQADVLAHVSDAVVALDLDGRVTYWNDGAAALHGRTASQALGRPLEEVVTYLGATLDDSPHDQPAEAALRSEAARNGELILAGPDGRRRFVSVSVSVLCDDQGTERGLLAVSHDVTAQREMSARLRHQASHDALTGLPNRTLFRKRIAAALARDAPFAVLFVDLDRFKVVNDSLGHGAGDRLLTTVAQRLRQAFGPVRGAVVARLGGDEFGVMAPTARLDPEAAGATVLQALAPALDLGPRAVSPSASVGVVAHAERYDEPEAILRDADTAMYAAKHGGRGRLAVFAEAMHERAALRFGLEHDLPYAAGRGQLRAYFQPIVDLDTGHVIGFESLIRWAHPELGLLAPGHFLPLAEELGLVTDLDRWMLDATCAEVATWGADALGALALVSLNCSDQTFLSVGLADYARAAADQAGLPPGCLMLELTERALVDIDLAREVVGAAQRNGIQLAIDDFGAGYSSLGLLHALPVDGVKIDRTFIRDLEVSRPARAVVRAVVGLSDDLGMRAIGEGVETPEQLRVLREAGARHAQGYLFARPVPAHQARAMLKDPPWADSWDAWTRDLVTA